VQLTEAGAAYATAIESAFNQIDTATAAVVEPQVASPLHVVTTAAFAVRWLGPRLGRLWQAHPDLDLRLHELGWRAEVDFDDTQVDLAVRIGEPERKDVESVLLMPGTIAPMCSPILLAGSVPLQRKEDLCHHKLLHGVDHGAWRDWFARAGMQAGDAARGPVFDDTNLIYSAALSGQGVGLLHTALTREERAAGQLVQLFDEVPGVDMGYYVVYPTRGRDNHRIVAIRDWLLEACRS
jgi:LysR family glycine cleavage system transcriptional activator